MSASPSREEIVHRLRLVAAREDTLALSALLDPEVVALTDGAGDVVAPVVALRGHDHVVPEVIALLSQRPGIVVTEQPVNGAPALVVRISHRVVAILSFGIDDGVVTRVWITRSPQKLQRWNRSP
jgi:hypothetical protein